MSHREGFHEWRLTGVGGSDQNILQSGDPERIHEIYEIKIQKRPPADLSNVLAVFLGTETEEANRKWYRQQTDKEVVRVGDRIRCETHPFLICTLDGVVYDGTVPAVWEAKMVSSFWKSPDILRRYMPQLQHNMFVTGYDKAYMSVFFGNTRHEIFEVNADPIYQSQIVEVAREFWDSVQTKTPPARIDTIEPPIEPVRTVDMAMSNSWCAHAVTWLEHKPAAKKFNDAAAELKKLVEADVIEAYGAGIRAKRSKNGAITISEEKV